MCNRIASFDLEDYEKEYGDIVDFTPQYHVFSYETKYTPRLPIVLNDGKLHWAEWGLIPNWARDYLHASELRENTVNARDDSLNPPKASYKNAMKLGRFCLVPVNGFFEHMDRNGFSFPHYIFLKDRKSFCFAGIWDIWLNRDTGEEIRSFSILTCVPNKLMAKIHNKKLRMPVILEKADEKKWLTEGDLSLLVPYPDEKMDAFTITKLLTSKKENTNVPQVMEKKHYPELDVTQSTLF